MVVVNKYERGFRDVQITNWDTIVISIYFYVCVYVCRHVSQTKNYREVVRKLFFSYYGKLSPSRLLLSLFTAESVRSVTDPRSSSKSFLPN